jgi:hypothetical protein
MKLSARFGVGTKAMRPLRIGVVIPLCFGAAGWMIAGLCGCESGGGAHVDRAPEAAAPAAGVSSATTPPPTPELEANSTFFNGQIETEVLLSRSGFAPKVARSSSGGRGESGGGGFRGGFGGGGAGGGGGGRRGGGMGGGRGGEPPAGRSGVRESEDGIPKPNIRASNEAPVQFHLRLTNHGKDAIEVEVSEFNSDLGNFVVLPRKLTIPAGESVEAEPMTSRLGLKADEIPLILAVRVGGRTEKQTLALKVKPAATPP